MLGRATVAAATIPLVMPLAVEMEVTELNRRSAFPRVARVSQSVFMMNAVQLMRMRADSSIQVNAVATAAVAAVVAMEVAVVVAVGILLPRARAMVRLVTCDVTSGSLAGYRESDRGGDYNRDYRDGAAATRRPGLLHTHLHTHLHTLPAASRPPHQYHIHSIPMHHARCNSAS
jgi:hypothetical protein